MPAESIRNYLKQWGLNPHGEPLVKLTWSDTATELRLGEFNIFYSHIYVRTEVGVRRVLKYSWLKERWILERWFPPQVTLNPELPESNNGSYEPIYVFQDINGESLPLSTRVVELICSAMFNRPPSKGDIHQRLAADLERADKAETTALEDGLEISSPLGSSLSTGEAVAYGKHKGGM